MKNHKGCFFVCAKKDNQKKTMKVGKNNV